MFKAVINDQTHFEINKEGGTYMVDKQPMEIDIHRVSEGYFHIIHEAKSYRAELVSADYERKSFIIKVNGQEVSLDIKDRFDLLLEKLGMTDLTKTAVNDIKAPMPGLILDIKVKVGDQVVKGDQLLVLEAMKMENILKAPGEGEVKEIKVNKGDSVEKNQILIQF